MCFICEVHKGMQRMHLTFILSALAYTNTLNTLFLLEKQYKCLLTFTRTYDQPTSIVGLFIYLSKI